MPDTIITFSGTYRFLSNFYPSPITYNGLLYPTVEHAYQAAKTDDFELKRGIAQLVNPATAKKIGQMVPLREDWETVKIDVMRTCLALKFAPDFTSVTKHLMATYPMDLVEGNTWHDNFWGDCHCTRCASLPGLNWLGQLLMERREQLWRTTWH